MSDHPTPPVAKPKVTSRLFHNLWSDLRLFPSRMLVRHARALEMIILLVGFAIGFYAIVTLLFVEPYVPNVVETDHTPKLDTDAVDTLELWMEERETATENPLQVNNPAVFGTEQATDVH